MGCNGALFLNCRSLLSMAVRLQHRLATLLRWHRRGKKSVVFVEIIEHPGRYTKGLREDIISYSIQTHWNPNIAWHAIIEGKQKLQVRAAYGLDGMKPSLRNKEELSWSNSYRLFDGVPSVVWSHNPKLSFPFEAVVQFPGIGVPVGNSKCARLHINHKE